MPYVLSWTLDRAGRHPCVGFDNRAAATRLVKYLLELGHRRFAMIAGITANNERATQRRDAVRDALAARGIRLPSDRIVEKPFTFDAGREGLAQLLDGEGEPPTVVVCGNDVLALGAIAECDARGVRVPEALSITGFDDMDIAALMKPGLTTVRFPTADLGTVAAGHLLARLAGRQVPQRRELPVELVVRESTAPPPRARRGQRTR
jgi:LacI family transcriptional regulator